MSHRPPPAVSSLESHLGFWLRSVSNSVSSRFQGLLEARGVSVPEWVALRMLFAREETRHANLIETLGMTKGATSKVISRLEDKGLIGRRYAESNGRDQIVFLTAEGKRLVPQLAALADENDAHFFGHLDARERDALMTTMRGLAESHRIKSPPVE